MRVICYGDSNTYGYDPRSWIGGQYPKNCRWVDILAANSGWDIQNQGENGREIPNNAVSFSSDTDLLIVMLGTNDLLQFQSPVQAADKMEHFLTRLNLDRSNILLIAPPPMKLGEWVPNHVLIENSVTLASEYHRLSLRLGIRFLDAGTWNVPIAFDGVHFTEEGHQIFADRLFEELSLN